MASTKEQGNGTTKKTLTEQCANLVNRIEETPWPGDAALYQPYEWEQILLPELANCLAVRAYLAMAGVNFTIVHRANAEDMSPSGRVPFLKVGSFIVAGLEPIVTHVTNRGHSPNPPLDDAQRADLRAFLSLVTRVLGCAESYITWLDEPTYSGMTRARYGVFQPWPLGWVLSWRRRRLEKARLTASGCNEGGLEHVLSDAARTCRALSIRLQDSPFFFGSTPTELDAAVFGHVYAIATWRGTQAGTDLADTVRSHPRLLELAARIAPKLGLPITPLQSIAPELPLSSK